MDYNKNYFIEQRFNGYFGSLVGIFKTMTVNDALLEMKNKIENYFQINENENYRQSSFANFDTKDNVAIVNKLKILIANGFKNSDRNVSVVLWSKNIYGVGKTHLLYAMVKEYLLSSNNFEAALINDNKVVINYKALKIRIMTEYELINKIRDTFKSDSGISEGDVFEELKQYDVLCIDDIAKYTPSSLEFYQRVMFELVNDRYNNRKSLLLTTNKTPEALTELLGCATADRLSEMTKGYRLEFKGESHREK